MVSKLTFLMAISLITLCGTSSRGVLMAAEKSSDSKAPTVASIIQEQLLESIGNSLELPSIAYEQRKDPKTKAVSIKVEFEARAAFSKDITAPFDPKKPKTGSLNIGLAGQTLLLTGKNIEGKTDEFEVTLRIQDKRADNSAADITVEYGNTGKVALRLEDIKVNVKIKQDSLNDSENMTRISLSAMMGLFRKVASLTPGKGEQFLKVPNDTKVEFENGDLVMFSGKFNRK